MTLNIGLYGCSLFFIVVTLNAEGRRRSEESIKKKIRESRKCVIPVVCVKLGKWYVVKHKYIT